MEDAEQVDAEYQHHRRDDERQHKRRDRVERKRGAERAYNAAEHKERHEPSDVEQDLWPYFVASSSLRALRSLNGLFGERRRHRQQQPAHHRHAGGERRDDADDKRGAVGYRTSWHQVDDAKLLQNDETGNERERYRYCKSEVRPLLPCGELACSEP